MVIRIKKIAFTFFLLFLLFPYSKAQLIINEISQGPSGSKEYIELLVVGTPNCSTIPCMDLRGYYIDDNNGNQATGTGTGIAQGCVRFTNNLFWSCIPIGTLIVIYNDVDINSSIPPDDISITDGNCKLIIPVSNCTLFEENISFPSMSSAAYPTSGFTACANWASLAMANGDDSFQTIQPTGNAVFSVSWGNNTINPIIYFSGTSAATVAYMANSVDNNPNNQSNWTRVTTVGNQTPGAANTAANALWISAMNNSCTALTPLIITTSSTNTSCTCDGTATVIASGGNSPYTYSWAPSGGNAATATGLCAGSYTVTATSSNGCTETATQTIVGNTGLTVTVNSPTICAGQSTTLTATGATGYLWSTGATTNSITVSPASATSYTVSGTSGSCSGTAIAVVTVGGAPAINVNSATICTGQTATLTATGGTTYLWSTGSTANSITESPASTTSYSVTGTNGGCSGTVIATVTVGNTPAISVNSETICIGQTVTLTATGGATYLWSTGSTANSITDGPTSTSSYTVTGTNGACSGTAIAAVTVVSSLTISVNSETICAGQTVTLAATGAITYLWSTGSSANSITESPASATSYTVTGTSGGCSGTAIATVSVISAPVINVNSETICAGQTATLTATGGTTYLWSTGSSANSITENPGSTTSYTVTGTDGGCADSAIGLVTVNSLPDVKFNGNILSACEPFCTTFTDSSSVTGGDIASWYWDLGGIGVSDVQHPQQCFNTIGQYSITLTVSSTDGCSAEFTHTNMVTLDQYPVAEFLAPQSLGLFEANVFLTDNSSGASSWNWNFGDVIDSSDNSSILKNPTHTYSEPGTYCITLVIGNNTGCLDTSQHCIIINKESTLYVPNSFSPNGDGINDEFYCKGENINEFEMSIYNRWGDMIYATKDINEHWNGSVNKATTIAQQDAYVYIIIIKDIHDEISRYTGSIKILR